MIHVFDLMVIKGSVEKQETKDHCILCNRLHDTPTANPTVAKLRYSGSPAGDTYITVQKDNFMPLFYVTLGINDDKFFPRSTKAVANSRKV